MKGLKLTLKVPKKQLKISYDGDNAKIEIETASSNLFIHLNSQRGDVDAKRSLSANFNEQTKEIKIGVYK